MMKLLRSTARAVCPVKVTAKVISGWAIWIGAVADG